MPCAASTSMNWLLPGFFTSTLPLTCCATTVFPGTGVGVGLGVGVGVGVGLGRCCGVATVKLRCTAWPPTARTANVCTPSGSPVGEYGETHAANCAESTLHSNGAPGWAGEKANTGARVGAVGPLSIVVEGAPPCEYGVDDTLCGSEVVEALSVH